MRIEPRIDFLDQETGQAVDKRACIDNLHEVKNEGNETGKSVVTYRIWFTEAIKDKGMPTWIFHTLRCRIIDKQNKTKISKNSITIPIVPCKHFS